jgi:hypothetical protein
MNFLLQQLLLPFFILNIHISKSVVNKPEPIKLTYNYVDFKCATYGLTKEVFEKAINGYNKLVNKGKVKKNNILTICDLSQSSKKKRLYVLDLKNKKVLYNLRVAHGQGSGEEFATSFGNQQDSHKSSLGFYTTGKDYEGENGYSMKLNGIEANINDQAYERAIVLHGSEYVTDEYFKANNKIGRSWGCPAVSSKNSKALIVAIKKGSCFFIYHNNKEYNKKSTYIKK